MVRNIDLAELVIFYGSSSIFDNNDNEPQLRPGVQDLVQDCHADDTAVVVLLEEEEFRQQRNEKKDGILQGLLLVIMKRITAAAPNPKDLYETMQSLEIQPKGFGGSSGFGSKAADPTRPPLAQHCVVLATTEDQSRAARACGMRVLCLEEDNSLADGVVNCWTEIGVDDIGTPGSFWLNPPHPRDDDNTRIDDIEAYIMDSFATTTTTTMTTTADTMETTDTATTTTATTTTTTTEPSEEELLRMLADIDSL